MRARGHAQPPVRQDRRPGDRRGAGGRPDRPAVLRHLAVAADVRAAGRRADPAGGAGGHPGRRAVRRHDHPRPGRRPAGRALLPGSGAVLSGAAPPGAAGPAVRVGHRRGAEEGAHPALVRGQARDQAGQRVRADRDLGRHQPRGHGPGAGRRTVPLGRPGQQRARLCRRRAPVTGAARCARRDRLLRGLRRPRVHQRSRAHRLAYMADPHRRASGSTWAGTTAAGSPTASWSSSAAGIPRSRSAASASRSARSRTPCCGCQASATARWSSPGGRARASAWWPSTPARGRWRPACCGTGWPSHCPSTWSRRPSAGGSACR